LEKPVSWRGQAAPDLVASTNEFGRDYKAGPRTRPGVPKESAACAASLAAAGSLLFRSG